MTFFETSYAEREDSAGSMSIHFLSFIGMVLGNSTGSLSFVFLLLPLIWLQNSLHSIVTFVLQADLQELLCRCYSNPSQIYLIHEKF